MSTKKLGTFKDGRPVTQADVDRWAAEAEQGYDVDQLIAEHRVRRGPGRPPADQPRNRRLQVRVDDEMYQRITAVVAARKQTRSQYLLGLIEHDLEAQH
jgi:predicted transcriptional regulator